jgi:hypothetical protein
MKDRTGSFGSGFAVLAALFLIGTLALVYLRKVWLRTWSPVAASRAGLLAGSRIKPGKAYAAAG